MPAPLPQVVKVSKDANSRIKIDHVRDGNGLSLVRKARYHKGTQVEGAIVMALGAANVQEITFKDGLT